MTSISSKQQDQGITKPTGQRRIQTDIQNKKK